MFKRWMFCALVVLGGANCHSCGSDHAASSQAAKKRAFGEDCSGRDQCESGVCMAGSGGKLTCSKECKSDGDCGHGARCLQLFGSDHGQLCVAR
jgi:hypothetical protein